LDPAQRSNPRLGPQSLQASVLAQSTDDLLRLLYGQQVFTQDIVSFEDALTGRLLAFSPLRRLQINRFVTNGVLLDGSPNGYDTSLEGNAHWGHLEETRRIYALALKEQESAEAHEPSAIHPLACSTDVGFVC
jgi:hypothetical protein